MTRIQILSSKSIFIEYFDPQKRLSDTVEPMNTISLNEAFNRTNDANRFD